MTKVSEILNPKNLKSKSHKLSKRRLRLAFKKMYVYKEQ